jgi:hypothetical protein
VHVISEVTGGSLIYKLGAATNHRRITWCMMENNIQDLADLAHACECDQAFRAHREER